MSDTTETEDAPQDEQSATPEAPLPSASSAPDTTIPPKPDYPEDHDVPEGNTVKVIGQRRPDLVSTGGSDYDLGLPDVNVPPPTVEELNNHDAMLSQDFAQGHIAPKTYQQLFNDEKLPGKIGTLFGLLVSGAGAGLTHQPNAVMEMMNKEIERDLEGQKSSNTNAQNWYKASLQHELQKAQIPLLQSQAAQAKAATYEHAVRGDFERARLQRLGGAQVDMTATNGARNAMLAAVGQDLQNTVNASPNGPTKVAGQQVLDTQVKPAIAAKINDNNTKTVGFTNLVKAINGKTNNQAPTATAQASRSIDQKKFDAMKKDVLDSALLTVPSKSGMTPEDVKGITEESAMLDGNRYAMGRYHDIATSLRKDALKGAINKSYYNAHIGSFGPEMAKARVGRFVNAEAQAQSASMFPTWEDILTGADKLKYDATMSDFAAQEVNTPHLNNYPQLKTPLPTFPSPYPEKKEVPKTPAKQSPKPEAPKGWDYRRNKENSGWEPFEVKSK
jgi:hypothetical protein